MRGDFPVAPNHDPAGLITVVVIMPSVGVHAVSDRDTMRLATWRGGSFCAYTPAHIGLWDTAGLSLTVRTVLPSSTGVPSHQRETIIDPRGDIPLVSSPRATPEPPLRMPWVPGLRLCVTAWCCHDTLPL